MVGGCCHKRGDGAGTGVESPGGAERTAFLQGKVDVQGNSFGGFGTTISQLFFSLSRWQWQQPDGFSGA